MSIEFHLDLLVERPVTEAFHHANSAKSQLQWVGSLVEVNLDPNQPWGIGTTFEQVHEESGVRQSLQGEVLEWEENQHTQIRLVHPEFLLLSRTEFEDLGPRCRLVQATAIELKSMKLRIAAAMVRGVVETRMRGDLERLKALLEG